MGLHRTTVNGEPVSDARLESGFTAYHRRILYSSYSIDVEPGPMVVGVELGRGFYAMTTPNVWGWHTPSWQGPRMALVQVELLDPRGREVARFCSDQSWCWADGATLFDSLYEGETFDGTSALAGWDRPGFDASDWQAVRLLPPPQAELTVRGQEPIRVVDTIDPVAWSGGDGTALVADFGTQLAGWVQVDAHDVPAGQRLQFRYAETRSAEGISHANPHVHADRLDTDEFIVGEHIRTWEPRFSYKGFRYVEVHGIDRPDQIRLRARHAHTDVRSVSTFTCGDEVLCWIDRAMRLTVRNNLHHLPTDTPVYEKNGWTGDVQVAAETMMAQYDLRRLFTKWLDDIADSQRDDGSIPVIVPSPGWGWTTAPEWTTLHPYLLERVATWYGESDLVERHRGPVLRHLRFLVDQRGTDGLVDGTFGDYLAPGSEGTPPGDDLRIAATCCLVRALRTTADLLERTDGEEVAWLTQAADELTDTLNTTFLDEDRGCYRSPREPRYRQTSNILPVAFGLTPEPIRSRVVDRLAQEIRDNGDRHDCGCLGLSELFEVLTRYGHADLALRVATGRRAPSWGAWMEAGETTMLEMWGDHSRSRNHYFMGAMARWLYTSVAGVRMLAPRWAEFEVAPTAHAGLGHASYHYEGPRGRLGAAWQRDAGRFDLTVTVPPQTRARVQLPGQDPVSVGEGRWSFTTE